MIAERISQPNASQVETLISFLERKPSLAKGFGKNQSAKQAARKEWDRITLKLNSMGAGPVKTAKKWIRYWSDKKGAVKKKAAARAAFRSTTDLGMVEGDMPELSNIEERILVLSGGEDFATVPTGDTHLQIQPFNEHSQENSPCILAPVTQSSGTCTDMPKITNQQLTPAIRNQQPQSEPARSTTEQRLSPTTRPSSRLTNPRRSCRRILQATRRSAHALPPSQRRSNLIGMADKILQIEQQRLDLDSRMLALMERNSERDHLLVEATKAMGEGLKALAEAIKG